MTKRKMKKLLALLLIGAVIFNLATMGVLAEKTNVSRRAKAPAQTGLTDQTFEKSEGSGALLGTGSTSAPASGDEQAGNPDAENPDGETPGNPDAENPEEDSPGGEQAEPEDADPEGETPDGGNPDEDQPDEEEADEEQPGKYVSDVFIAYGKTEDKAKAWLRANGWEPVEGDFNAGKASFFDDNALQDQNVAAVMGIKRTDDSGDAVTDMAVMNMKGGYSLPDYEDLLKKKKADINEFINDFMPVIDEYRANSGGEGSSFGKERADMVRDLLNKFYDGGAQEEYPANDTGKGLGDLFLAKTRQEGNNAGGDLEQIILESSGPAILAVEMLLAFGADAGKESWLTRAAGLTGDELAENLVKYVPEAAGQDVAASVVTQFLNQRFGDTARVLSEGWSDVRDEMVWYEEYNTEHELWQNDGEDDDAYIARIEQYFKDLTAADPENAEAEECRYNTVSILYAGLYDVKYEGAWGDTMGDFFNPADKIDYGRNAESFLPMAAALSTGQRASLDLLSLNALLFIGLCNAKGLKQALPDIEEIFKGSERISVYTGVNRGAFRGGVAITSRALMEQNAGKGAAFDRIWDNAGIAAIASYAAAAVSVTSITAGAVMAAKGYRYINGVTAGQVATAKADLARAKETLKGLREVNHRLVPNQEQTVRNFQKRYDYLRSQKEVTRMGTAGRWMMGIGGAILVAAAVVKAIQFYKYYDRTMTPIPRMIVDESDIVTYLVDDEDKPILDENGDQKKAIDFKTYEYYSAVKCNRPEVGEIGDWQSGVKEYKNKNCYDIADLNADMGQEWLALYTVKSEDKGFPILADSLTLQYKSKQMPKGCTKPLHLFTYTNAMDLGDMAYAFNNDKGGVYFFWDEDQNAGTNAAASAFTRGQIAFAGGLGLALGILGTTFCLLPRRRKAQLEAGTDEMD